MNIILLTILLTLAGACLVTYLVLLGVLSYKLMKFKDDAEKAIKHLERWINDNYDVVTKEMQNLRNQYDKKIEDESERMNLGFQEIYRTSDDHYNTLSSKIDSRVDKLTEKVESNYNLLKETQKVVEKITCDSK